MSNPGMTPDRWRDIKDILADALDRPPNRRDAYLDRACAHDPELRAEVESLIDASERAPALLDGETGSDDPPRNSTSSGDRIGPYRILRELDRGGMGIVYLGERADGQFEQNVAIKLLPRHFETNERRTRFRAERQILATLDHPNIARLLDGGVTDDGHPFLVMEYVEGMPITEYCAKHESTLEERIRLLRSVCDALQVAHRNLVVHRDLKPSNILITESGTVKLVDFGIAKLLDPDAVPATRPETRTGQQLLTPEYAAPEQIQKDREITTATDIYQLGILAYELLSGTRPFDLSSRDPLDAKTTILEGTPAPPSESVRSAEPNTRTTRVPSSPSAWQNRLQGDLDTIVLKALRKAPDRRYASAEALGADLRRFVGGKPIMARPTTWRYRARKLAERNRWKVAAAAVIVILLGAYAVTLTVQANRIATERDRAEQETAKAEAVADYLEDLFEQAKPSIAPRNTQAALHMLDRGTRMLDDVENSPAVQAELAHTVARIYRNLNDLDRADSLARKSLDIRRDLHGAPHPERVESLHAVGQVLLARRMRDSAAAYFRRAARQRRALSGESDPQLANHLKHLAYAHPDSAAADSVFSEALRLLRRHHGARSLPVADALSRYSHSRHLSNEEARALSRQAIDIYREHEAPLRHAGTLNDLALRIEAQHPDSAITYLRRALQAYRSHPNSDVAKRYTIQQNLAAVLQDAGRPAEAEPLLEEVVEWRTSNLPKGSLGIGYSLYRLGRVRLDLGDPAKAEQSLRATIPLLRENVGSNDWRTLTARVYLSQSLQKQGYKEEAETLFREIQRTCATNSAACNTRVRKNLPEPVSQL